MKICRLWEPFQAWPPRSMVPGAKLTVSGAHDRQSLRIWADTSVDQ